MAIVDATIPAVGAFEITKNDAQDLPRAVRSIYVGTAGDVKVTMLSGDIVTFKGCLAGLPLEVQATRVWSTGTSAADMVGMY